MATIIKGVSDHPAKTEMEELWGKGLRGQEIYDWLLSEGYPLIKVATIARYGQRYWTTKVEFGEDASDGDVLDTIREYSDLGFVADRLSHATKNTFVWETDDDGNRVQSPKAVTARTVTFRPQKHVSVTSCSDPAFERAVIAPVNVKHLPSKTPVRPSGMSLAVSVPDIQIGYYEGSDGVLEPTHDERAIDVARQIMLHVNDLHGGIDLIVNQGDNLDLPGLSSHRTPPSYVTPRTTQASIDRYATELACQRAIAPDSTIVDLPSNHGARLINTVIDKMPSMVGVTRAGEEAPVLSVPYLCRFDDFGVQIPEGGYPDAAWWASPNLKFVHGHALSSTPGGTAAKYLQDRVSVVTGHFHRSEILYRVCQIDGQPYVSFAGSAGCLCRVDGTIPSYKTGANDKGRLAGVQRETWNQGIWIIWFDPDGIVDAELEICKIEDGKAIFRGKVFETTVDLYGNKL